VHEALDQVPTRPGAWHFPVAAAEPGGLGPPPLPKNGEER
jgi:hypothetical protein